MAAIVVNDTDVNRLAASVNAKQSQGYAPNGGLMYSNGVYYQPMESGSVTSTYVIVREQKLEDFLKRTQSTSAAGLGSVQFVEGFFLQAFGALPVGTVSADIAPRATNVGYINTVGTVVTDANWLYSDYYPCKPGDQFKMSVIGHTTVCAISYYNASKTFVSGVKGSANNAVFSTTVTVPSGVMFYRLSFGKPGASIFPAGATNTVNANVDLGTLVNPVTPSVETIFKQRRRLPLTSSDKVILYGDSISSTDYPWYKESMESLTGAQVYNGGFSGYTAAQLAANAQVQRIYDYQPNMIVIMVGGNDTGAPLTVGTFNGSIAGEPVVPETNIANDYNGTYFIQAVSHLMRKVKVNYYNIRTRANLTGGETEAEKTAKIDALLKPFIVFCTPLPQKRTNANNIFSLPANWERKRQAVIECCNKYQIGCVDLNRETAFDMSVEPYWVSPTDKLTNNGVYFMDGLHPNKWGYQIIAQILCAEAL